MGRVKYEIDSEKAYEERWGVGWGGGM